MIEAGTEQEGKMKKRILSFILCIAILCSNSGLTYAADFTQAKSGEESLPFTFYPQSMEWRTQMYLPINWRSQIRIPGWRR